MVPLLPVNLHTTFISSSLNEIRMTHQLRPPPQATPRLEEFSSQQLTNLAWAYSYIGRAPSFDSWLELAG